MKVKEILEGMYGLSLDLEDSIKLDQQGREGFIIGLENEFDIAIPYLSFFGWQIEQSPGVTDCKLPSVASYISGRLDNPSMCYFAPRHDFDERNRIIEAHLSYD